LAATVYLATLGKHGLRRVAELCFHKSHYAAEKLAGVAGIRVNPQAPAKPFFKEFVVELPVPAASANRFLRDEHGIVGGYDLAADFPDLDRHLLIAVTETVSRADIDRLVSALEELVGGSGR
jgi:glycine dehydrogenase subunit 1